MAKPRVNVDVTKVQVDTGNLAVVIDVTQTPDIFKEREIKRAARTALRNIARDTKSFWDSEAGKRLTTSRVKYRNQVTVTAVDDQSIVLSMGDFAKIIENAEKQRNRRFDMKPGFMASPKAVPRELFKLPRALASTLPKAPIHIKAAMRFLIIPMRWSQGGTRFRTVSDKSPKDSWIWKPKKNGKLAKNGEKILKDVQEEMVKNIIPRHMKQMLEDLMSRSKK